MNAGSTGAAVAFPKAGTRLRSAALVALALVPAWSVAADIGRGGVLYSAHCANCHGARGDPVLPGTPDFRRGGGLLKSDAQLLAAIRNGKGVMPGYLGILKDKEMLDVMAFLRTLI